MKLVPKTRSYSLCFMQRWIQQWVWRGYRRRIYGALLSLSYNFLLGMHYEERLKLKF